jgi:hypothetical protein
MRIILYIYPVMNKKPFLCELCAAERFEPVVLSDSAGMPFRNGLVACLQCRSVYWPKTESQLKPRNVTPQIEAPLATYGLNSKTD